MIRVGFLLNYPTTYKGAINYFRNLFFAIDTYLKKEVEIFLFVPSDLAEEFIEVFSPYATIVKTSALKRKSAQWIFDKVPEKLFNINPILDHILLKHNIDVVSHSSFISKKIKTINWIMDFQHEHLPQLWTESELKATNKFLHRLIKLSDRIFVSSLSARNDLNLNYASFSEKVNVLHFVSQPQKTSFNLSDKEILDLKIKYNIDRQFFYLPNQFWAHKNHDIVFKAIKALKEKGFNPLLITSGLMRDFRSKGNHVQELLDYVKEQDLEHNILFLGLIPYHDVLDLFTLSLAVINPSFFEGWSSTVEEAKTMGKCIVLSNIDVHIEQDPEFGLYFNPQDSNELENILSALLQKKCNYPVKTQEDLTGSLKQRTEIFAKDFYNGILPLINKKPK